MEIAFRSFQGPFILWPILFQLLAAADAGSYPYLYTDTAAYCDSDEDPNWNSYTHLDGDVNRDGDNNGYNDDHVHPNVVHHFALMLCEVLLQ
jgi:hypothetical protein